MTKGLAAMAASVVALTSCGGGGLGGDERTSMAEDAVRDQLQVLGFENPEAQEIARPRIEVNGFRKTDGVEREMFGQKIYQLEYEADVEFTDAIWLQFSTLSSASKRPDKLELQPTQLFTEEPQSLFPGTKMAYLPEGSAKLVRGSVIFVMKESGWNLEKADDWEFTELDLVEPKTRF